MVRAIRFSIALLLVFTVVACGDADEKEGNNTAANVTTNNTAANNTSVNNTSANNAATFTFCEDQDDTPWSDRYSLRMNSLTFKEGNAGFGLNGLVVDGFNQDQNFPIVVLLDIRNLEPEAGTFELRGASGLKTDTAEEYEWDPQSIDTYFEGTFDPECGAINVTVDRFEFVATFESETGPEQVVLPISELEFEAAIAREGDIPRIDQGEVAGFITKEEADTTLIAITPGSEGIPLTMILGAQKLDYNTETGERFEGAERGPENADAWFLEAVFTAIDTTIID